MHAMTETVHRYFPTISLNSEIPDSCIESALKILPNKPSVTLTNVDEIIKQGLNNLKVDTEQKLVNYNETINKLLDYLTKGNL